MSFNDDANAVYNFWEADGWALGRAGGRTGVSHWVLGPITTPCNLGSRPGNAKRVQAEPSLNDEKVTHTIILKK